MTGEVPARDDTAYYEGLGFKAGVEIHQQLDTSKLFCSCSSILREEVEASILRRLSPTQSEMGELDAAALAEAGRSLVFNYEANGSSCLMEADEEPPHPVNGEALEIGLLVAHLLHARPIDEVHYMRKIVIDGSNTTGFQRTALYARDGHMELADGHRVGVYGFWLEEDAARRMEEGVARGKERQATFRLDRLGIPLIELATSPDVRTPAEMRVVAERLGTLLRATKRVKRGLGTIRQDLNVSIKGGVRTETKGVQDLRLIPEYVAEEVERQRGLVSVREELARRGVSTPDIPTGPTDVTGVLEGTGSKVLSGALEKGGRVLALRLPGFAGLLKGPDGEDGTRRRLGTELAGYAISMGLRGVFHSDELPAYGVTAEEVDQVAATLGCSEGDAFVMAAGPEATVTAAMEAVASRAASACGQMQPEVRGAQVDGTTRFMRPLPGSARMYPETDVPPVRLTPELLAAVEGIPVEMPEQWVERISREMGLAPAQAEQLINRGQDAEFERLAGRHDPKLVGLVLLSVLPELEREGVAVDDVEEIVLDQLLSGVSDGLYSKEILPQVLGRIVEHGEGPEEAAKALGLSIVDAEDVAARIDAIVRDRGDLVRERGRGAMGPLMGEVMKEFRGQVDGKELSRLLGESIDRMLAE
ncbi:MAG: Glu-tRNA(Gln) amidotransferase subunit GatE [Thermoplasmata archaeon]|nr:Glu-tRNA(Gln) amidotransferase subunit GatE [Thermoplasmata archaeon]